MYSTTYKKITYGTWYTIFDVWCVSYDVCYIYNMMWYDATSHHKCTLYTDYTCGVLNADASVRHNNLGSQSLQGKNWTSSSIFHPWQSRVKLLLRLALDLQSLQVHQDHGVFVDCPASWVHIAHKLPPQIVILPEYELRKWALHSCFEADLAAQATWLFQCQTACLCHGFGVWCKLRIYFKPWQSFGQQNVKMAFGGAEPRRSWIFAHAFDGGICTDWNCVQNLSAFRGAQASATSWQRRCPAARRRAGMAEEVADSELLLP